MSAMSKKEFDQFEFEHLLSERLHKQGINDNERGYIDFPVEWLLTEEPALIVPFEKKSIAERKGIDRKKTVICFFTNDGDIYTRFRHLDEDVETYRDYMGVIGFDLSPRVDARLEQQQFNIRLSQLATAVLATQGIKIIPNFRIGEMLTIRALNSYPRHTLFCTGSLGCAQKPQEDLKIDLRILENKIISRRPSKLLVYGKLPDAFKAKLAELEQPYREYTDYRNLTH